jgi:hypothetical protein
MNLDEKISKDDRMDRELEAGEGRRSPRDPRAGAL